MCIFQLTRQFFTSAVNNLKVVYSKVAILVQIVRHLRVFKCVTIFDFILLFSLCFSHVWQHNVHIWRWDCCVAIPAHHRSKAYRRRLLLKWAIKTLYGSNALMQEQRPAVQIMGDIGVIRDGNTFLWSTSAWATRGGVSHAEADQTMCHHLHVPRNHWR